MIWNHLFHDKLFASIEISLFFIIKNFADFWHNFQPSGMWFHSSLSNHSKKKFILKLQSTSKRLRLNALNRFDLRCALLSVNKSNVFKSKHLSTYTWVPKWFTRENPFTDRKSTDFSMTSKCWKPSANFHWHDKRARRCQIAPIIRTTNPALFCNCCEFVTLIFVILKMRFEIHCSNGIIQPIELMPESHVKRFTIGTNARDKRLRWTMQIYYHEPGCDQMIMMNVMPLANTTFSTPPPPNIISNANATVPISAQL